MAQVCQSDEIEQKSAQPSEFANFSKRKKSCWRLFAWTKKLQILGP